MVFLSHRDIENCGKLPVRFWKRQWVRVYRLLSVCVAAASVQKSLLRRSRMIFPTITALAPPTRAACCRVPMRSSPNTVSTILSIYRLNQAVAQDAHAQGCVCLRPVTSSKMVRIHSPRLDKPISQARQCGPPFFSCPHESTPLRAFLSTLNHSRREDHCRSL